MHVGTLFIQSIDDRKTSLNFSSPRLSSSFDLFQTCTSGSKLCLKNQQISKKIIGKAIYAALVGCSTAVQQCLFGD